MMRTAIAEHRLRRVLSHLSPRHRRWRQLLDRCDLDPDDLPRPVPPPGPQDVIICGSPRTGTALVSAQLFQPPHVVTVMEPWDAMRLPPRELFDSLREEIDSTGRLARGRLDVEALRAHGQVRWHGDGDGVYDVGHVQGHVLAVKFPALWRYLELLPTTRFVVCVRDPLEVIPSYLHSGGRLAEGYDYDIAFNRQMNRELMGATSDPELRRVLLYEYINSRLLPHLERRNVFVLRYERWFSDPAGLIDELSAFLDVPLRSDNVRLREPRSRGAADERLVRLVATRCPSAASLGYG